MRSFLLMIFLGTFLPASGQDTITIRNTDFIIEHRKKLNERSNGIIEDFKISRIEDGRAKYIMRHIKWEDWGDCNSISTTLGDYSITDTGIVLYTYWAKAGDSPAHPCGYREEIYAAQENGQLRRKKAKVYFHDGGWMLENGEDGETVWDPDDPDAMQTFRDYYKARILFGREGMDFENRIRTIMEADILDKCGWWDKAAEEYEISWRDDSSGRCW